MKHLTLLLGLLSLTAIALAVDAPVDKYVRVDAVLADAVPNVATVRPSGDKTGKQKDTPMTISRTIARPVIQPPVGMPDAH